MFMPSVNTRKGKTVHLIDSALHNYVFRFNQSPNRHLGTNRHHFMCLNIKIHSKSDSVETSSESEEPNVNDKNYARKQTDHNHTHQYHTLESTCNSNGENVNSFQSSVYVIN